MSKDFDKEFALFEAEIGGFGDDGPENKHAPAPKAPNKLPVKPPKPPALPSSSNNSETKETKVTRPAAPMYSAAPVTYMQLEHDPYANPPTHSVVLAAELEPALQRYQAQQHMEGQLMSPAVIASAASMQLSAKEKATASEEQGGTGGKIKKKRLRAGAGKVWEDPSLDDWPDNDYRLFCGDLGNEVNENTLAKAFARYPTFAKAKVIREKRTGKTKGFGFVSFTDPFDCATALKEMNGKYVGNRPIKLRKSSWAQRELDVVRKKKGKKSKVAKAYDAQQAAEPVLQVPEAS
jgi:hypothetical protein